MRKLFIKCSDERSRFYSIITTIARTENGLTVFKEACYPEGNEHLARVASYGPLLEETYAPVKACPADFDGRRLIFKYLTGESLEKRMRKAAAAGDAGAVGDLLLAQKAILTSSKENETVFTASPAFETWFGDGKAYEGSRGFKRSNFDATAANIIFEEDGVYFIDYEWVMDFAMPADLVLYHCVRDAWYHIPELEDLLPLAAAMRLLGVKTDLHVLQRSYEHFYNYVITDPGGLSFAAAKRAALKAHTDLTELKRPRIPSAGEGSTAEEMWRDCSEAVAVLQGRIGRLKAELDEEKRKYAELDDAWFRRWDEVRAEAALNKAQFDDRYAHYMEAYKAMETDRDTWKGMYEDVTGSRSFKAMQKVKGVIGKK